MRIVLLAAPDGNVIAREDQLGQLEATFVLTPDGGVLYRNPLDSQSWFVARDQSSFEQAAVTWNRYCDEVQDHSSHVKTAKCVQRLNAELKQIGVLENRADNLWTALLEQVKDGLL